MKRVLMGVRMSKVQLWVICKSCGREFDTHMRLDRKSFDRGTLAANYHACPFCGQRLAYRKADYLVRDNQPAGDARTGMRGPSPP